MVLEAFAFLEFLETLDQKEWCWKWGCAFATATTTRLETLDQKEWCWKVSRHLVT